MRRLSISVGLLTLAITGVGCGGSDYPETFEVRGMVTLGGRPVPDAVVTFIPEDGQRSATGNTEADGSFRLTTFALYDGALPGKHGVGIYPRNAPPMKGERAPDGSKPAASTIAATKIPDKYGAPGTSGFTAEVKPDGDNSFTFDLQAGK